MDKPGLSVSLGLWQDRAPGEVLRTARVADELGYGEIWIGEMATFDAFALGAVVAERTARAALTVGPLAVAVRDPVMIAMGVGSLTELTGRAVNVALGSSSPVVVQQWHGRRSERTATALAESATAVRTLLAGGKAEWRASDQHSRLPAADHAAAVAADHRGVRRGARSRWRPGTPTGWSSTWSRPSPPPAWCRCCATSAGRRRPVPPVAVWLATVVDPSAQGVEQLRRGLVAYLSAPGYGEMFAEAGFGDLVSFARTAPHPRDLLAAIPAELVGYVSLLGDEQAIRARLAEYADAGVDQIALVPGSSDADPAGVGTLTALAP